MLLTPSVAVFDDSRVPSRPETHSVTSSRGLKPMISQQVPVFQGRHLGRPLAEILLGGEEVAAPALAVDLGQVAGGDEPGVGGAGALGVHSVAPPRLVPEDKASRCVALALRPPLRLVVLEHEGGGAGALAVPLVALAILGPVVLVVARAAAAVAPVALAGVGLEHHEVSQWTRTLAAHLVAVALTGVGGGGKVEMGLGAGILGAEAHSVIALHQELTRLAGAGGELPVAGAALLPVDILVSTLAARPPGVTVKAKHLTFATGTFGFQLKTLAQRLEIILESLLAFTVCRITGVVICKH